MGGRIRVLLSLALLSALAVAPVVEVILVNAAPILIIDPFSKLEPGGYIIITVFNFPANSTLYVLLNGGILLGVMVTDELGSASANITIPPTLPPGTYTLSVIYADGTSRAEASDTITLAPSPASYSYKLRLVAGGYATVGETASAYAIFYNETSGALEDPDTLDCMVFKPDGVITYPTPTKVYTGVYKVSVNLNVEGTYAFSCKAARMGRVFTDSAAIVASEMLNYIMSNMTSKYQNLTDLINGSLQTLLDKLGTVEGNITDAINTALLVVLDKVNTSEGNITALVDLVTSELILRIDSLNATLLEAINVSTQAILANMSTVYNETNATLAKILSDLSNLTIIVNNHYNNLTVMITGARDNVLNALQYVKTSLEDEIALRTGWVVSNITSMENNLTVLVTSESGNIQALVKAKVGSAESNLTSIINQGVALVVGEIRRSNETLHIAIADSKGEIIAFINETCAVKLANLTTIQGSLDNLTQLIDSKAATLLDVIKTTEDNLTAIIVDRAGFIQAVVTSVGAQVVDQLEDAIRENVSQAKDSIVSQLTGEIALRAALLAALLNATNESLHLLVTDRAGQVLQALSQLSGQLEETNSSLANLIVNATTEGVDIILGQLSDYYEGLYALISAANTTIIASINDAKVVLARLVKDRIAVAEANLTGKIELTSNGIVIEIGNSTDRVLAAIASANQSLTVLVASARGDILGSLSATRAYLGALTLNASERLEENLTLLILDAESGLQERINLSTAVIESLVVNKTGEIIAVINASGIQLAANIARVASLVEQTNATTVALLTALSQQVDQAKAEVEARISSTGDTLQGIIVAIADNKTAQVLEQLASSEYRLNQNLTQLSIKLDTKAGQIVGELGKVNASLRSIVLAKTGDVIAVIDAANTTILAKIADVRSGVEGLDALLREVSGVINHRLTLIEQNLTEQIVSTGDEVKSVASNYGVSSTTASIITLLAVGGLAIFMRRA